VVTSFCQSTNARPRAPRGYSGCGSCGRGRGGCDCAGGVGRALRGARGAHAAPRGIRRLARRGGTGRRAIGEGSLECKLAAAGTHTAHALGRRAREECLQPFVPAQLATRLRVEVHTRGVAGGHEDEIAGLQLGRERLTTLELRQLNRSYAPPAAGPEHRGARQHGNALLACACGGRSVFAAQIRDGRDEDARLLQLEGNRVGVIGRRHKHRAGAGSHAVAVEKGARRPREHDPRPVVAREHERPLNRARGEHYLARAHLPLPFTG